MDFNKKVKISNKDRFHTNNTGENEKDESFIKDPVIFSNNYNNNRVGSFNKSSNNRRDGPGNKYGGGHNSGGYSGSGASGGSYSGSGGGGYRNNNRDNDNRYPPRKPQVTFMPIEKKETLLKIISSILDLHNITYEGEELVQEFTKEEKQYCSISSQAVALFKKIKDQDQYNIKHFASIYSQRSEKYFCIVSINLGYNMDNQRSGQNNYSKNYNDFGRYSSDNKTDGQS